LNKQDLCLTSRVILITLVGLCHFNLVNLLLYSDFEESYVDALCAIHHYSVR